MSEKLEVVITATDKASGVFSSIGKTAGGILKAGAMAAAAGITALGAGLGYAISEAMAAQKTQAQLAAVLKSTGGAAGVTAEKANELANQLSKVTTFEDDAIVAGESMLLTFTNIGADVFPAATEAILDLSTATGQDLQSSAVQLGKALNDPIAGITALSRVGVTFTEAQKKMITKMVEAGDVAGAQKLILAELKREFGGSAVAAGETFSGQLTILKNTLGNVAEEVGTALLPALQDIVSKIEPVIDAIGSFVTSLLSGQDPLFAIKELIMKVFGLDAALKFDEIADAVLGFAEKARDFLLPILEDVKAFLSDKLIPFITGELVPWLAEFIPAAIQVLADFWTNVLQPAIAAVWDFLSTQVLPFLVNELYPWLKEFIPKALKALADFWELILLPAITKVWAFIKDPLIPIIGDIVTWLKEHIPGAIEAARDFIETKLIPALTDIWDFIKDKLVPRILDLYNWLKVHIPEAIEKAKEFFDTKLKPAFEAIRDFIRDDLIPKFNEIIAWLETTIKNTIETFKTTWAGVKEAFKTVSDFIYDHLTGPEGMLTKVKDFLQNGWDTVVTKVQTVWGSIKNAVQPLVDIFNAIKGAIQWILSNIGNAISGASNYAASVGEAVWAKVAEIEAGHGGRPGAPGGPRKGLPPNVPDFNYGGTTVNNWNLTINSQEVVDPVQSFNLMRALAGA